MCIKWKFWLGYVCFCDFIQYVRIAPTTLKPPKPYAYSVKIINRGRKSDYTVSKLHSSAKFSSVEELKESFHTALDFVPSEFGFIVPGHGLKGRQRWIRDDTDLDEMYSDHPNKQDFILWCYTAVTQVGDGTTHKISGQKRAASTEAAPKSKSTCVRKITEVEEIIKDLREKHGTSFTTEQFSMWAHVIHIGKHSSREAPPDLPFFRQGHKKTTSPPSLEPSSSAGIATSSTSVAVSPGKRVSLRSECINQLEK